ncbi:hypothetical protein [Maridesulfovibrio sp.]|uniref:hypothetical protein n=1 Tax=Maridesulfovibrio sp. TaxID=2795000 RepID=UPI002A187DCD|nr:hypothetical protein [Maridesulfovibrio sp.]
MKYVCKKDCYVRNPQGKLQHFKAGMTVDYADGVEVAEHFEPAGGPKTKPAAKKAMPRTKKEERAN